MSIKDLAKRSPRGRIQRNRTVLLPATATPVRLAAPIANTGPQGRFFTPEYQPIQGVTKKQKHSKKTRSLSALQRVAIKKGTKSRMLQIKAQQRLDSTFPTDVSPGGSAPTGAQVFTSVPPGNQRTEPLSLAGIGSDLSTTQLLAIGAVILLLVFLAR